MNRKSILKPTWAICPDGFKDSDTCFQTLMVFSDTLRWLESYQHEIGIVFQRSEIIYDQFTIRFRYDSAMLDSTDKNLVLDYLVTVCSEVYSFRKDSRTKVLVTKSEQCSDSTFDVEFRLFYDLPF